MRAARWRAHTKTTASRTHRRHRMHPGDTRCALKPPMHHSDHSARLIGPAGAVTAAARAVAAPHRTAAARRTAPPQRAACFGGYVSVAHQQRISSTSTAHQQRISSASTAQQQRGTPHQARLGGAPPPTSLFHVPSPSLWTRAGGRSIRNTSSSSPPRESPSFLDSATSRASRPSAAPCRFS